MAIPTDAIPVEEYAGARGGAMTALECSWRSPTLPIVFALALSAACAGAGKYVWVDAYEDGGPADAAKPYVLAQGDVVQVRVFNQEHLSTRTRVRADGNISLPLLNDVPAAGLTPVALAEELDKRLKDFVKAPVVTVSVEESRPNVVYVTGEVTRPGAYPLEPGMGVLQALVNAGGLTPTASNSRIFVLRKGAEQPRIRFTYQALTRLEGKAPSFTLRSGDVVVVE